ncbi:MAG: lysylphosphatidylglycerol synthase transmembrane domain-containing protein [Bryobacteraceae bacterium]|jgi:uncharacterized protein (TIRG00374 family)
MKSDGKGRLWSWILAVPLAAVLLYYALRGVDWSGVWRTIAGARWGLVVVAGAFTCCSFFLRALRWRILLNAEARLSVGQVFCASMSGYLGNAFLPARAGELVRTLIVSSRSSLSKTYVLTTALSERLMDAIALVLWSSIILLGVHPKPRWMTDVSRTTAAVATLGAIAIAVLPHAGSLCRNLIGRMPLPHKLREGLLHLVDQVLLGMRAFHSVGRFLGFVAFTVTIWLSDAATTMICGRGLGLELSFPVAVLLLAAMGLSSALPSTPGYVGIYQFVAVTVLVPFGFSKDAALAYVLVAQAMAYVTVLLLGLPCVYVLKRRRQP